MSEILPDIPHRIGRLTSKFRRSQQKWLLRRQEKREKSLQVADEKTISCQNCGETLKGPFCHACGQKDSELRRPWWSLFNDVMDEFLSTDSRILRTILVLVVMPGMLTRDYLDGHRARYVTPMKLYLITTLIFFLLLEISNVALVQLEITRTPITSEQVEEEDLDSLDPAAKAAIGDLGKAGETRPLSPEEVAALQKQLETAGLDPEIIDTATKGGTDKKAEDRVDTKFQIIMFMPLMETQAGAELAREMDDLNIQAEGSEEGKKFLESIVAGFQAVLYDPELLNETFNTWLPRAMLVLVPIFALMMRVMHWGGQRYYINQMIFSLHYHTYIFILMMPMIIIVPMLGTGISGQLFALGAGGWLLVALKTSQRQGWIRTILKFFWIGFWYLVVAITTMVAILIVGLVDF